MKIRVPIAVLCVLAVIAVVLIATSGDGSGGGALDPVAQAAETTTHVDGAQMSLKGSVTVPGFATALSFSGQGSFNFKAHEGNLTLSMSGLPEAVTSKLHGAPLQITELFKASSIYIGSPLLSGKLPGGARWLRLNLTRFQQAVGLDPRSLTSSGANPTEYLQYLKAAGAGASVVGHDSIRGVATTHYTSKIDLLKAAEAQPGANRAQLRGAFQKLIAESGLRNLPVNVWIDGRGLVRKIAIELGVSAAGQQVKASVESEFYDFGATPSIKAPAGSEVFDMTQQALQGLSSVG